MKNNFLGIMFFLSILMCGGGIDSNNMNQFWFGAVLGIVFGGLLIVSTTNQNFKRIKSSNDHSRVSYLR